MAQGDIHFEKRATLENISLDIGDPGGHEAPIVALGTLDALGNFKAIGALAPLPTITTGQVTAILDAPTAPTPVNISFASGDPQEIIPAPGDGYRLRITSLWLICIGANAIILMKSGASTIGTIYGQAFDKNWIQPLKLNESEAFVLESNVANQIYGQVCYYGEAI